MGQVSHDHHRLIYLTVPRRVQTSQSPPSMERGGPKAPSLLGPAGVSNPVVVAAVASLGAPPGEDFYRLHAARGGVSAATPRISSGSSEMCWPINPNAGADATDNNALGFFFHSSAI